MKLAFLPINSFEAGSLDLPPTSHSNRASAAVYMKLGASSDVIKELEDRGVKIDRFKDNVRVKITPGTLSVQTIGNSSNLYMTAHDLSMLGAAAVRDSGRQISDNVKPSSYVLTLN